jgi:hypothetical protein
MSFLEIGWTSFIGAMLIAVIIGLHVLLSNSSQDMTSDLISQENMAEFTRMANYDFAKVGYRDTTGAPLLVAKSDTLSFLSDIDNNNTIDTVKYIKGSPAAWTRTANPNDFLLYRIKAPADTTKLNVGFTALAFTYFDSTGAITTNRALVRGFTLSATLEGRNRKADSSYAGVAWSNTYYPRNLNTR